jgi:hypothetical protein
VDYRSKCGAPSFLRRDHPVPADRSPTITEGRNLREGMEKSFISEKRKHPRFSIDMPVKYARARFFKSGKYGRAVNASEGGLLVYLPEETEIGQNLALQLFLYSPSGLNILETSVRVIWKGIHVRKDMGWEYRTGVSFTDISPEDMSKFKNFFISFSQQPPYAC